MFPRPQAASPSKSRKGNPLPRQSPRPPSASCASRPCWGVGITADGAEFLRMDGEEGAVDLKDGARLRSQVRGCVGK